MSPLGHHLTAVSSLVVYGSLCFSDFSIEYAIDDLTEFAQSGAILPYTEFVLFSVGVLLGSRSPDWLEISFFVRKTNHRVIKHRTLTHSPWLWSLVLMLAWFMPQLPAIVITGWALSSLLHVLIDMGSPTGIPLRSPFGKRTSLYIYQTNKITELKLVAPFLFAAFVAVFLAIRV